MIRSTLQTIMIFTVSAAMLLSCGDRKSGDSGHAHLTSDTDEWKEMDEFHMVMAEAYHPYKDSLNLQPAKDQAGNMVAIAEKWATAPLPHKVSNESVKMKLVELRDDAVAFENIVNAGDDTAIGKSLEDLHHKFHDLQDAWYHSGEDEADHSDHHH
jgi:hypothetical protein